VQNIKKVSKTLKKYANIKKVCKTSKIVLKTIMNKLKSLPNYEKSKNGGLHRRRER